MFSLAQMVWLEEMYNFKYHKFDCSTCVIVTLVFLQIWKAIPINISVKCDAKVMEAGVDETQNLQKLEVSSSLMQ